MIYDAPRVTGLVRIRIYRAGNLIDERIVNNVITDAGDGYHARMVAAGVGPATLPAPAPINGMKLGTGNVTPAKDGLGATIAAGTYLAGSARLLDTGSPTVTAQPGSGAGVTVAYRASWPAGIITATIREAVLCIDADADAAPSTGSVIARITFDQVKGPNDRLSLLWMHNHLA